MKLIDRLIWHELAGPLINSILMFLMVLFAGAYLFSLTELLVQGVPLLVVAQIAFYSLPVLVTQTLPMGMLLASLLSFGRLSADSEHVALFASGVSFFRVVIPVGIVGLLISVVTFAWNETVVPPAQREFLRLKRSVAENVITSGKSLHYLLQDDAGRVTQFVNVDGGYDQRSNWFRRVTMVKMSEDPKLPGQPDFYVFAERARPQSGDATGLNWQYEEVRILDLRPGKNSVEVTLETADTGALKSTLHGADVMGRTFKGVLQEEQQDNRIMTFAQLRDKIREERARGNINTLRDEMDLWEKVSVPLASLIFGLMGAPLGIRPHRGSKAIGFGVAIGIIFTYWVVYRWMFIVGQSGGLPPFVASFAACILGLIAAAILVARTRQ